MMHVDIFQFVLICVRLAGYIQMCGLRLHYICVVTIGVMCAFDMITFIIIIYGFVLLAFMGELYGHMGPGRTGSRDRRHRLMGGRAHMRGPRAGGCTAPIFIPWSWGKGLQ